MNGKTNGNVTVKEFEFDKLLIQKLVSIFDICIRNCHYKYFLTFDHICVYDNKLTNITNKKMFKIAISGKSMYLYELNKKLTIARQRGFIFNQTNTFRIKICSNLSQKIYIII